MKGQIPILEMITVTVILFITFGIFFPQGDVQSRWDDANVILKGRDMALTMDRTGMLNQFVADRDALTDFLNKNIPERNLISWTTLDGTVQPEIIIACNCTTDQIDTLLNSMGRLKLNGRNFTIDFVASTLSPIQRSDALLIWGRTDLEPFRNDIVNYLRSGNGVIGLADIENPDEAYTEIFGVAECASLLGQGNCGGAGSTELEFLVPTSVSQPRYQAYKFFHHLPIRSVSTGQFSAEVPVENEISTCPVWPVPEGFFSFKSTDARYWVCFQDDTIYFDTDGNNVADTIVSEREDFVIAGSNFRMSYIDSNSTFGRIFVSIKPEFRLDDFRDQNIDLVPADLDNTKILLRDGNYNGGQPIPVVTVNRSTSGMAVWAPESLVTDGQFNHDERLLLASMISAASNKESRNPFVGEFQIGFLTPYVNVVNIDMFEVYQFNLGLGFPF